MPHHESSTKFRHFITSDHIGICVFSKANFFLKSPYAMAINYFLDWQSLDVEENSATDLMFLPTIYNRTFPVILNQNKIDEGDITKKLKSLALLIPGLTGKQENNIIEIPSPKIALVFDDHYDADVFIKTKKILSSLAFPIRDEYLKTQDDLRFDLFQP